MLKQRAGEEGQRYEHVEGRNSRQQTCKGRRRGVTAATGSTPALIKSAPDKNRGRDELRV